MIRNLHEVPTAERLDFLKALTAPELSEAMSELAESTLLRDDKQDDSICILANSLAAFADIESSQDLQQAQRLAKEMAELLIDDIAERLDTIEWARTCDEAREERSRANS
jgi:hypothetical protein